jgi:hypothetical protein
MRDEGVAIVQYLELVLECGRCVSCELLQCLCGQVSHFEAVPSRRF